MTDPGGTRVAVYIDFDNIVISRYDQLFGRGQFQRDRARGFDDADKSADPDIAEKLQHATVDIGAVIDFASSYGTLVLTRFMEAILPARSRGFQRAALHAVTALPRFTSGAAVARTRQ
jgi:hypothetical protein